MLKKQEPSNLNFSSHPDLNNLKGTEFQKRVWAELLKIPPGETLTYGQLAKKLNSHPRAIGQACRANPLPIIIPCHRVVGKNNLGGYYGKTSGELLAKKQKLLAQERIHAQTNSKT